MSGPTSMFVALATAGAVNVAQAQQPSLPPELVAQMRGVQHQFVVGQLDAMKQLDKLTADKASGCDDLKSIYKAHEQILDNQRQMSVLPQLRATLEAEIKDNKLDEAYKGSKAKVETRCGPLKPQ